MTTRRAKQPATDLSATEFLTVQEMCRVLKIGRSTWYEWRAKGKTPGGVKLPNGEIRVGKAVFEQWLGGLEAA